MSDETFFAGDGIRVEPSRTFRLFCSVCRKEDITGCLDNEKNGDFILHVDPCPCLAQSAVLPEECPYGDPLCPCPDGDPCHYEGENPMVPPVPNYVQRVLDQLNSASPGLEPDLAQLYALLALTKGTYTTLRDTHDAWALWRNITNPAHQSLIPFDQLSIEVQELDRKYMNVIHAAVPPVSDKLQWISCKKRLPTKENADEFGFIWVCSGDIETISLQVNLCNWGAAKAGIGYQYWMPTNLVRPEPPEAGEDNG